MCGQPERLAHGWGKRLGRDSICCVERQSFSSRDAALVPLERSGALESRCSIAQCRQRVATASEQEMCQRDTSTRIVPSVAFKLHAHLLFFTLVQVDAQDFD